MDFIYGPSHNWPFKALEKEMKMATTKKPKRARGPKGKYKGDDKSTPDINEAYTQIKKRKSQPLKK